MHTHKDVFLHFKHKNGAYRARTYDPLLVRHGNCDGTKPCQCSIEFFTRSCEGTGSDGAEAVIQYCDDAYTEW